MRPKLLFFVSFFRNLTLKCENFSSLKEIVSYFRILDISSKGMRHLKKMAKFLVIQSRQVSKDIRREKHSKGKRSLNFRSILALVNFCAVFAC